MSWQASRQRLHQLRYPERQAARVAAQLALATGRIERRPCEVCGAEPAEMHHDDYARPLEVRFLCRPHHREADKAAARPRYVGPRRPSTRPAPRVPTPEEIRARERLEVSLDAHLHHEGRRRGAPLTRDALAREWEARVTGQDICDYFKGHVPLGGPGSREARIIGALTAAIEAGVAALEAELVGVFGGKTSGHVVKKLARLAARHLYGMDDEKGETP